MVCYKCFYRAVGTESHTCPECNFALIAENRDPTSEIHLSEVFNRYSVRSGAPKLPGLKTFHGFAVSPLAEGTQTGETSPSVDLVSEPELAPVADKDSTVPMLSTSPRGGTARPRRSGLLTAMVVVFSLAAGIGAAFLGTAL